MYCVCLHALENAAILYPGVHPSGLTVSWAAMEDGFAACLFRLQAVPHSLIAHVGRLPRTTVVASCKGRTRLESASALLLLMERRMFAERQEEIISVSEVPPNDADAWVAMCSA